MSTAQMWRDMFFDAQDRIQELTRDRALLAQTLRTAARVLKPTHPLTAQSLIDTVEQQEIRDAKWMVEHDQETEGKTGRLGESIRRYSRSKGSAPVSPEARAVASNNSDLAASGNDFRPKDHP